MFQGYGAGLDFVPSAAVYKNGSLSERFAEVVRWF